MKSKPKICVQCGGGCSDDAELCERCQTEVTLHSGPSTQSDGEASTLAPTTAGKNLAGRDADHSLDWEGKDFGDYLLLEEIARGGMGVVYKARHKKLNRMAAVKMIRGGQFSSDEEIQRFHIEAEAAARLDHPGIVPIYEISSHEGQPFFAMKFVEGGSLAAHRERMRKSPRKMVAFIAKVAQAVHHAHQRGILHRDIKPANILIDEDDNPLITDLGLAKNTATDSNLTQTGVVVGTPSYMPPEQAQTGQELTTAVDIYSLGAILYEMLVGRPPHQGKTVVETVMHVINDPVQSPRTLDSSTDRDLELICMKCLESAPEARYASAGALASDLTQWLAGEPISVRPPSIVTTVTHWIRRNQGIGYAFLALLTGCLFSFPVILSLLGALEDPAGLYADTDSDPRPLIYSFAGIPQWVSLASSLFVLILWPLLGLFVCLITRPRTWKGALFNGSVVGGTSALLFSISVGWVLFMVLSQATANDSIRLLADSVWRSDSYDQQVIESMLFEKYPLLEGMPENERVNYVSNRIFADGIAEGPLALLILLTAAFLMGAPVAAGTTIAHSLMSRNLSWWILIPRYLIAWAVLFVGITTFFAAIGNGNVNGRKFSNLSTVEQVAYVTVPVLIAYLVLRRWKKQPVEAT